MAGGKGTCTLRRTRPQDSFLGVPVMWKRDYRCSARTERLEPRPMDQRFQEERRGEWRLSSRSKHTVWPHCEPQASFLPHSKELLGGRQPMNCFVNIWETTQHHPEGHPSTIQDQSTVNNCVSYDLWNSLPLNPSLLPCRTAFKLYTSWAAPLCFLHWTILVQGITSLTCTTTASLLVSISYCCPQSICYIEAQVMIFSD